MTHRLDDIDRQIIYALMNDARNTSAPMIAEGLNVSAGTIRNRIDRLEAEGVIQGYTATIDFERAGGRLTSSRLRSPRTPRSSNTHCRPPGTRDCSPTTWW